MKIDLSSNSIEALLIQLSQELWFYVYNSLDKKYYYIHGLLRKFLV